MQRGDKAVVCAQQPCAVGRQRIVGRRLRGDGGVAILVLVLVVASRLRLLEHELAGRQPQLKERAARLHGREAQRRLRDGRALLDDGE